MRKLALLAVLAVLVVGAVAAPSAAGKKKDRTVEKPYVGPVIGTSGVGLLCQAEPVGCARFEIKRGERFVTLTIKDSLGQPVYASVYIYGYSDGTDSHDHICGESSGPLPLSAGVEELVVLLEPAGAANGCSGVPSAGTIVATFSKKS